MSIFTLIIILLIPGMIAYPIILDNSLHEKVRERGKWWIEQLIYSGRALLFAIIWPLLLILMALDKITRFAGRNKAAVSKMKGFISTHKPDDGKLRYSRVAGTGVLYCNNCAHTEEIVGFLHGFGDDHWTSSGYQCQVCGKFHAIERSHNLKPPLICECNGDLSRDEKLFCPLCKSDEVKYRMSYIT